MEYISKSEKETYNIAKKIASKCYSGDVYALFGDLGSGKTTFTKGFSKSLGITNEITSPTFVIIKQYPIPNNKKDINILNHIDCYRFEDAIDAESVGMKEILSQENSITIIEWPEKIMPLLASKTIKINFKYIDEHTRKITTNQ